MYLRPQWLANRGPRSAGGCSRADTWTKSVWPQSMRTSPNRSTPHSLRPRPDRPHRAPKPTPTSTQPRKWYDMTDVQTKSVTENSTPRRIVHALNSGLDNALARDRKVLLLGEDIADPAGGVYKVTKGLSTKYGNERVRATPIAETSI